ncbi:MAG: hypothetical protein V4735_05855 [Pseudomonadota bacterium]
MKILTIFALAYTSIAACGSAGAATVPAAPALIPVSGADSPIPGTAGVKSNIGNGVTVFLLSLSKDTAKTSVQTIVSDPSKSGGDPKDLIGKTFLSFDHLTDSRNTVVILSPDTAQSVFECNPSNAECGKIGFNVLNKNQISFEPKKEMFYAIEK